MKKIVCLLNGLTDVPLQDLGGLSPLQKAQVTTLDSLAKEGELLALKSPENGGHEAALMALLGENSSGDRITQGPLEAHSLGYVLTPRQVALSMRFISIGEDTIVDVSDALLSDHEGKQLCRDLNGALGDLGCYFLHLQGVRSVLVSEHPAIVQLAHQPYINPLKCVGKKWKEMLPPDNDGGELVKFMSEAYKILEDHEVNSLKFDLEESSANAFLLYNGGKKPSISSPPKVDPQKTLLYTTSAASIGVAKLLGIETLLWSPEQRKYEHLITLLGNLDEIFKGKDTIILDTFYLWNSTYKGELLEKVKTIEWLDRYVIKPLAEYAEKNRVQLEIFPLKHCDIRNGDFLPEEVPALIWSPGEDKKNDLPFDEEVVGKVTEKKELADLFPKQATLSSR